MERHALDYRSGPAILGCATMMAAVQHRAFLFGRNEHRACHCVACTCGWEAETAYPIDSVNAFVAHATARGSGSPEGIDLRDLAADLRAAAQSGVLMPEFGSDAVTSLTRWADLLAPGSPEGPQ